jgi:hypothetical protein
LLLGKKNTNYGGLQHTWQRARARDRTLIVHTYPPPH